MVKIEAGDRTTMTPHAPAEQAEILVFEVAGHRYGLPADAVVALHRMVATVPLPTAPPGVEGLANIRGRLVPVLDVRTRFRLAARPASPSDHLVVADAGGRTFALRVDRAVELVRFDPADRPASRGGGAWVANTAGGLIFVHDPASLFPADEAAALPGGGP